MPATISDDPLTIRFVFPDGSSWSASFAGLPNPVLAHDLAVGLAANAHPHGGIGTRSTAQGYANSLRCMVIDLSDSGFTSGASDLTRPLLMRFWLANRSATEPKTRMMLKGFDAQTHALTPQVRDYLAGAPVKQRRPSRPYPAYTDGEWERLETALKDYLDSEWRARKQALAAGASGTAPRSQLAQFRQVRFEDMCWLLLRQGPMRFEPDYFDHVRDVGSYPSKATRSRFRRALVALFPGRDTQIAYALLLGVYSGIVPDGIADLGVSDIDWAGDTAALVSYIKGRTSRESTALPGRAVKLLGRWLEHSETMRRFAPEHLREQLWLTYNHRGFHGLPNQPGDAQGTLVTRLGLVDDAGQPLLIHRSRIRATYSERLARRGWTGRALIDPNHTAQTEGDHYITPSSPARLDAIESIIEDGQTDILRKGLPAVVLSSEQTAELVEGFPVEVRRLNLDTTALHELVGGERDVFSAACADQLAGLHGPAGQPCPARPWVCLLCPLAVFLPRHAPNLLRLNAYFSRQFRQMPTAQFMRVFGPYADRLTNDILPKFSDAAKMQAALEITDTDTDTEIPLRPEEATQ